MLIPTAEPFFFSGGRTGCLLVHGFTGTPKEMRWLGEYLAGQGHTVLGVRLAGHATLPADMIRTRWTDWLASVEDGWRLLDGATHSGPIFLVGLSMGGVLSLVFAARAAALGCPVAGAAVLSTPYALLPDWRLPFIGLFHRLKPYVAKGPPDWRDLEAAQEHISYPDYPTRSIAELRDLIAEMQRTLPQVAIPLLVMHARGDDGGGFFDPHSPEKILAQAGSLDKRLEWVEDSGHVITREPQRERAFATIAGFIAGRQAEPQREP